MNTQEFLLNSVNEIYSEIYPNCYETDKGLYDMLKPYITLVDQNKLADVKDHMFSISVSDLLSCIETTYGIKRWKKKFSKTRVYRGIEDNIKNTLREFSSVEGIYLYGVCPSLTKINFGVNITDTVRPRRVVGTTLQPFADVKINKLSFRMREVLPQSIVDEFNIRCMAKGLLANNVMLRRNVVGFENVEKMFDFFNSLVNDSNTENIDKTVYNALSAFDNDEIREAEISVITDFGIV